MWWCSVWQVQFIKWKNYSTDTVNIRRREYRHLNYRMLTQVMGLLVMIESIFMIVPCVISYCYGESDYRIFLAIFLITLASGTCLHRYARPTHRNMGKREGYLLTASVWVVFSIFGMLPFIFTPAPYNVAEAFTEAMSCFTTTGATIVPSSEIFSHGVNTWRAMMQWVGGMGIILFTLAVIPMFNHSGGMQMFNAEASGITHDKLRPRVNQTAKSLWSIYLCFTLILIGLLWAGPMTLFDSFTHGLVTMATGGLSYYNDGVEHFNSRYVKIVICVFMFLGSINFSLIFSAARGRVRPLYENGQLRFMLKVTCVASVIFLISQILTDGVRNWIDAIINSVFMVVSAMSTTCFTLDRLAEWGFPVIVVIMALMFFGGCAGSTSGGAKIDRLIVLQKFIRNEIWRALQPNSVGTVRIGRRTIDYNVVQKSIAFLCLDICVIVVVTLILSMMTVPPGDAFFITVSSVSNSGLVIDIGQLQGSLVTVPEAGKVLLAFVMLLGRLEFYTILVLFIGNFWHR